ncbi:hypothetical protein JXL19_00520 [bacterium]|nr:hypothetical protein [bacterium]
MKNGFRLFLCVILILIYIFVSPLASFASSPRRNISVEPRWGYYVFDTSMWKDRVYSRKYAITGGMKVNLELFRQILQLGVGAGYMREHEPYYYIYNIPVEASLNIRLKFSQQQLIVPYIGGGFDYSYFKEKGRGLDPSGQPMTRIFHNNRKGYHLNAGLQFLLNRFSSSDAERFDEKFGVNATYLTFEARHTDLTESEKPEYSNEDLSGWFYYMGILFEF